MVKGRIGLAIVAFACAIALAGCGSTNAGSGGAAGAGEGVSEFASEPGGNESAQQADEKARPYVGTWKADALTLALKGGGDGTDVEVNVPVVVVLDEDMTGKFTIGKNKQDVEWEVTTQGNIDLERAVITLHEPFELKGLECDPDCVMLELADSEGSSHLFYEWTSTMESDVDLGIDTMLERAS